jgi:hypothetical protein
MAGLSDYLAETVLNFMTGTSPRSALGSRYLALASSALVDGNAGHGLPLHLFNSCYIARPQLIAIDIASTCTGLLSKDDQKPQRNLHGSSPYAGASMTKILGAFYLILTPAPPT